MPSVRTSTKTLQAELADVKARLAEAEETLEAIRTGAVDALIVHGPEGDHVFTLKGADQTYRALVEAMSEGALTLTPDGIILYCNHRFADIIRTPLEKIVGKPFINFVKAGWKESCFQFLHGATDERQASELLLSSHEGDADVFVHLSSSPFAAEDSKGISLVITDISARKKAEEALRHSEERFQMVASVTSDAIWDWDISQKTVWRSEGFSTLFRHPSHKVGSTYDWWLKHVHPEDRSRVIAGFETFLQSKESSWSHHYRFRRGDGTYAHVFDRARATHNEKGTLIRVVGTLSDVSEQLKAEAAQRELSKNIVNAQEQERRRVARELHDGVNQLLSASKYRLHSIEQQIAGQNKTLGKKITDAKHLVDKAIGELRAISHNLRPSELDDLGLPAALRSLCHGFGERTGIAVKIKSDLRENSLPTATELTIYRIIQEALNNVEKHSGATRTSVQIKQAGNTLRLAVCDDGCGFDATASHRRKSGWGLDNMRERASHVGGVVRVKSAPKTGTEVTVEIPI